MSDIAELINHNHKEVCERLTAIETTMKNNKDAYGDIPERVRVLEVTAGKVKLVGSLLSLGWVGLATWLGVHTSK